MSVSDNVGSVKCVLGELIRALRRARHFALVESLLYPTKARFKSSAGLELSPTHASLRSAFAIMIASSNSPDHRGAGCPIDISVFYFTPSLIPGWPACGPNFFHCS